VLYGWDDARILDIESNRRYRKYSHGHRAGWDDARNLEIESNSRYRKYKESAHIS
jgi:hypothetical protein